MQLFMTIKLLCQNSSETLSLSGYNKPEFIHTKSFGIGPVDGHSWQQHNPLGQLRPSMLLQS